MQHDPLIFRARLAEHRIFFVTRPIEGAAVDDQSADRIAVAADKLRERMHDDIGAEIDRLAQVRRCEGVVDDQRYACLAGDLGNRLDVRNDPARICDRLNENAFRLGRDRFLKRGKIIRVRPYDIPTKILV